MFAGFFPNVVISLMKKSCPTSYKENLNSLRFEILEANCKTFEKYVDSNNRIYRFLISARKEHSELSSDEENGDDKEEDSTVVGRKRKQVNVHSTHQDRKKKHK